MLPHSCITHIQGFCLIYFTGWGRLLTQINNFCLMIISTKVNTTKTFKVAPHRSYLISMPKYIDYNYVCFSIYINLTIICTIYRWNRQHWQRTWHQPRYRNKPISRKKPTLLKSLPRLKKVNV